LVSGAGAGEESREETGAAASEIGARSGLDIERSLY
jgi:hypothetical protein